LQGEKLWSTQPFPTLPKPFVRQAFNDSDVNNLLPDTSVADIRKRLAGYITGNMFNAPSRQGTVILPGFDGGAEWGGPAFDPESGLLFVNANEMPWVLTMTDLKNEPPKKETYPEAGKRLYLQNCMTCHGPEKKGSGNNPTLLGVQKKYNEAQLTQLISTGRRMMPAFKDLSADERSAIASWILALKANAQKSFVTVPKPLDTFRNLPFSMTGYNKFLSKEGYPAIKPPWGTLTAINLTSGEFAWKIPLGSYPAFAQKGIITGTENYGGPVVTAGGLIFIAATRDSKIRAFNKRTGELLWETALPAPGFATPAIYTIDGKQYIAIACGGGKLGTSSSDAYVVFALPGK
jgi:quinoprotein glucose dehydrogenase